ncbi:MAG: UDP-N-acetylmuramyl-tripeptide synthetase [Polyangiaceae bacterium]|nr:UDP-N-acetylmuramyl-tripeptide synthetase [Polyangiaceae bacterium]
MTNTYGTLQSLRYSASSMLPPPPPWSHRLFTAGVTGTNGKTTTTSYLASALGCLHGPVLRITTVGSFLGQEKIDVADDYDGFVEAMKRALDVGAKMAVLECTSEALAVGFAKAWPISIGVFTNLTRDHLDSHGSAEHYLASKAQLFVHLPPGGAAVLNAYDPASALLAEVIPKSVRTLRYGLSSRSSGPPVMDVDIAAERVIVGWDGTRVKLWPSSRLAGFDREMHLRAIGEVYAENALAALAAAMEAGISANDAVDAIEKTPAIPGRFEVIGAGPRAVVDYGHSPDALERTLATARSLCAGRLIVVFGAGGERDRGKREAMGRAARIADRIVLTSDNPRREDPALIAAAIRRGVGDHPAVSVVLDREKAIFDALGGADVDDVVVIAGRGPETEQVFASGARRLVDAEVARRALGELVRLDKHA